MLDELAADLDPIRQFRAWLDDAFAAGIPNADAMAVATATPGGEPSARFVLLKSVDQRGFVFYTNVGSRKARELDANPRAALVFYWVELGRQVRVEGAVEPASHEEADRYFRTRPRASRISAWASPQSEVIPSRATLESRVSELEEMFPDNDVPLPPFWGGFRVAPETIEFWEHRDSRLHDRLRYTREGHGWRVERLAP
jgi:pyridoxamine 5'-phosphate oxidase